MKVYHLTDVDSIASDDFATRFHKIRLASGLTQQQIADRLGVTRPTVGHWERGVAQPKMRMIEDICDIFDCKVTDLIGGPTVTYSFIDLDDSEDRLIKAFRSLPKEQRKTVLAMVEGLAK